MAKEEDGKEKQQEKKTRKFQGLEGEGEEEAAAGEAAATTNSASPSSSSAAATNHIVDRIKGATDPGSGLFDIRVVLSASPKVPSPVVGKTLGVGPTNSFKNDDLSIEELSRSSAVDLAAFTDLRDQQACLLSGCYWFDCIAYCLHVIGLMLTC